MDELVSKADELPDEAASRLSDRLGPAEYHIVSIADFANVPDDRLSACIQEFVCCLFELRKVQRETGYALVTFTWVDDGIPMIQAVNIEDETIPNPNFPNAEQA